MAGTGALRTEGDPRSVHVLAAVERQWGAGNEVGIVGRQEAHAAGDGLGRGQPGDYSWNASGALSGTTGDWQRRGFGKNITNRSYSNFLANGTLAGIVRYVPRDDKRYAGIMLRKDF